MAEKRIVEDKLFLEIVCGVVDFVNESSRLQTSGILISELGYYSLLMM